MAVTTSNPDGVSGVYEAVGEATTLNELHEQLRRNMLLCFAHLQDAQPTCRDIQAGNLQHAMVDVGNLVERFENAPTCRIGEGLQVAIGWNNHLAQMGVK